VRSPSRRAEDAACDAPGGKAISTEDDYVRPDLPTRPDRNDEDYPRRPQREFDLRRRAKSQDEEYLRILSMLYYIFGALAALCFSIPLIHVTIGALMVSGAMSHDSEDAVVGVFFIAIGGAVVLLGWIFAACAIFAGYNLSRRKRYRFCFLIACLACIQMPMGTILGVFTIIVLARPEVKEMFERGPAEPGPTVEQ
jgi:hypothetical protein